MGTLDRQLRLFLGTVLVMTWIFGPLGWWGVVGFLPLVTGLTGVCPIYPLFGINTSRAARGDTAGTPRGKDPT